MNGRTFIHKIMIGLWLTCAMALVHAGAPLWTFTPLTRTTIPVAANDIATVRYQVTNQSRKTHTLAMKAIPGVTQITTSGNCPTPFVLGYQQSCTLNLSINGSALKGRVNGGPIVCSRGNSNQCYQPSSANSLRIVLLEATDKTIGLWHETTPSAIWGFVNNYQTFLNGDGNTNLGFKAYAADYVNFIGNLKLAAQKHGFGLGPIYFQGGDPGPNDWTNTPSSNNAFKYLIPSPATGERPMINQYVVEPLQKLGVRQFGLVVNLNSWNGSEWTAPWGWVPSASDPSPPTGLPLNVNPSAIDLFKLLYELNQELKSSYTSQNISSDNQLYITLLGFDNEGFSTVPPPNSCVPASSSGWVVNLLWNTYVKGEGFSNASTPQWGITGQSPPFEDFCHDDKGYHPVSESQREFAFVEYYHVPGEANPVYTFDHPGFVPCTSPWTGVVLNSSDVQCNVGSEPYYQIAYGVVTPSFSSSTVAGMTRNIPADPTDIYLQPLNGWSDIWNGILQSEVWQRTPTKGALEQTFIQAAYSMLNAGDNLTTLSQSSLYCTGGCEAGAGTPVEGTQWMLSIENFSSSYRTVINPSPTPQSEYISTTAVDTQTPFSSIALKYGPNLPFDVTTDKTQFILSHPTTASGTYEAFGGWGVDNLVALMEYMSQQNPLLNSFMIYEYAFVQLNDTTPA
ncbi:MAG: hypothetical protein NTW94_04355 [Legionellales bacterium]|nr:hypothetical protein [Legionellales bacterium]